MEKNYVVYQHITPDGMYYFGATSNIKRRWRNNGEEYKKTSLQPYIEKFGWDNIQHIVLFKDQTKENALWIENFLIETAREDGVCINKQRSGLISKDEGYQQQISKHRYEQNRDEILEKQKQYYEQNKDKKREYNREYREQNKDKIREYQREYRQQNKEKIQERKKQYYEQNKEQILERKKQYYEQNKDKKREYDRQRYQKNRDKILEQKHQREYQHKKLEKQLKEAVETTLF